MRITAVGRALPRHRYTQATIAQALETVWRDQPQVPAKLRRLWERMGVEHRHLVQPLPWYLEPHSFGATNDAWLQGALDLGSAALTDALARAGLGVRDIDAIFTVSVTGIASPALDARLANRVGLRADIKRLPLFGLGCVAGAAGIARASEYVKAYPDQVAVLLAVELCSLTLQRHDTSIAHLISAGLFGDGAAAVILVGEERAKRLSRRGPQVLATRSTLYPDTEEVMGWRISERGFEIVLSPAVPTLAREMLPKDVDALLGEQRLTREHIGSWVCHPGGPKVIAAMREGLGLAEGDMALARMVLRDQGNLSSVSVLMVLREVMDQTPPASGKLGLILAMGPAFCSEVVLVGWS